MAQLVPPSDEERELYYFGLPSCPKLVARSSSITEPWVNPQMPGPTMFTGTLNMYPRIFLPAEDNPALSQLWNDATSSLRIQILEAVSVADWAAIDILRVGLDKDDGLNKEFHNTLLIAVVPGSMSWQEGHSLALRCKTILEEFGIKDMHCEIRESLVTLCADATANAHIRLSSQPITGPCEDIKAEISDHLGTKIAMKDSDIGGTKGLYLELPPSPGGERRFAVLTCRHVALPANTGGLEEYRDEQAQPPKEAIQVDQPNYTRLIKKLETDANMYEGTAQKAKERGQMGLADEYHELTAQTKSLHQAMETYETPSSRVFGHLLYSPKLECTSDPIKGGKWYRDWALIELIPSRHQAQISALKNKVFVGTRESFMKRVSDSNAKGWAGLPAPAAALVDSNCAVELQSVVVPMSELIKPPHFLDSTDDRAILVAKYGAKTGLTLGLGNKLKSVIRRTGAPAGEISEEWCITSANLAHNRQARFSEGGDSGSCIWDMDGRVAGILMAGASMNELNDVTYAQPFERLITDIQAHGFKVSLI